MRTFHRETALYLLALLVGLAVRLIGLGALPLSDAEASWAIQAFKIADGAPIALGSQPAYVVLTSALFFLVGGSTNALARLIPALTGSALILIPALFRERLKPRPALILAFAIALEPGLTAISRQAGSPIMALTFTLAALGLWDRGRHQWAGVCAGVALMSGPALWPGLLGLAVTWALLRPFERPRKSGARRRTDAAQNPPRSLLITAGAYALGTILIIGTLFMTVPGGLSAWLGSLPDYLLGWTRQSDMTVRAMLGSLVGYQPLGLVLVVLASVRGWVQGSLRVRRLSLWMLVALLLAIFHPSREVTDLAWMLIPLWALASLEVARHLNVAPQERREILGAVALAAVILIFIWFNFLAMRRPGIPPEQVTLRTWLLFGSFFLLVVSLLLVGVGWSIRIAQYGALWGLAVCLGLYSLGGLMGAAGHRQLPHSAEMWRPGSQVPMADLLLQTVREQSAWSNSDPDAQPVVIAGLPSPALQWLLRDRPLEVREAAGAASQDPLIITPEVEDPALVTAYRGQSFTWRKTTVWRLVDLLEWLPFHEAAQQQENVILWVRADLFPYANSRTAP